ncbi:hypothetical protein CDAR_167791 [Caerostris darwini]|uniref:Uncharacterized protein n=1 Tax=Caerostris darwini TaxID=1538125 RepID=A0AAV4N2I8_9ARAC|nr:hypothetical protein CDAR_167791 [Caerostris darwini]
MGEKSAQQNSRSFMARRKTQQSSTPNGFKRYEQKTCSKSMQSACKCGRPQLHKWPHKRSHNWMACAREALWEVKPPFYEHNMCSLYIQIGRGNLVTESSK